jgi:hypothetical protein
MRLSQARWTVALALTLALHALLLMLLGQYWRIPTTASATAPPPAPRLRLLSAAPPPLPVPAVAALASTPQPEAAQADFPGGLNARRYRTWSEVHTRAAPVTDWNLVREAMPHNQRVSLVLTVWVSEAGVIDHVAIADEARQPGWVRAALAELAQTRMEPATRDDVAVPSIMTVELLVDTYGW